VSHARSLVDDYLARLGEKLEVPDLALSAEGHCGLKLDDPPVQVNVELLPDERGVVVHADMGEYTAGAEGALFGELLQGNLYGIQTRGGPPSAWTRSGGWSC
jgi:hypothetical protein